eukprot:13428605-Alexandrium_andersonii.AAC.1
MSASLVGSEMCIRDSLACCTLKARAAQKCLPSLSSRRGKVSFVSQPKSCLLYTSDAADDM